MANKHLAYHTERGKLTDGVYSFLQLSTTEMIYAANLQLFKITQKLR